MNVYEQTRGCKNSPIFNKDINRKIFDPGHVEIVWKFKDEVRKFIGM